MEGRNSGITLVFCVLGLYGSFLSWSILQERINTKPYGYDPETESPIFFKAPLVINVAQALFASIVGLIYSLVSDKIMPYKVFTDNSKAVAISYFKLFSLISITSSLSSPIGLESLKHVDYLAYLLAKSCKLIPVMLIHTLFYRTKFPIYKYLVAGSVTIGVAAFTLSNSKKSSRSSFNDGKTLLGLLQLSVSMILDGLTNSTQDHLFKYQKTADTKQKLVKITGPNLMCILNFFVFALTIAYTLVFKYESEVVYAVNFVNRFPHALVNILSFAILGSIGQVFVFLILEKFDSLILVTATVTRKMLSMILSVVLFGHTLKVSQWFGVGLVFTGIGYEAFIKMYKPKAKQE